MISLDLPDVPCVASWSRDHGAQIASDRAGSWSNQADASGKFTQTTVNVRSFGAQGDGITDDTAAIQAALDTGCRVLIPGTGVFYRLTKALHAKNSVLGSGLPELRMMSPDGTPMTRLLEFDGIEGLEVEVSGLSLNGNWDRTTKVGEQSHCIALHGCRNVKIHHCRLRNSCGDNIYIGSNGHRTSSNIELYSNELSSPFRCNIAITSATDVHITHNAFSKENDYVAAIDLEPNENRLDRVESIDISANRFESPNAAWTNLYSSPSFKFQALCRNVLIQRNAGKAKYMVRKASDTGNWRDIRIVDNHYEGNDGPSKVAMLALIAQSPGNGASTENVVVSGNTDLASMQHGGPTLGSMFSNVKHLAISHNRINAARSTGMHIVSCEDVSITNNHIEGTLSSSLVFSEIDGIPVQKALIADNYSDQPFRLTGRLLMSTFLRNEIKDPARRAN